jgi:hypothetical protein
MGGSPLTTTTNAPIVVTVSSKQSDMAGTATDRGRRFYTNAARDSAKQAMQAMHDHIAQTFPDLCPMSTHPPAPVAEAIQMPEPNDVPAVKAKPRRVMLDPDELVTRLERRVLKGEIDLEEARKLLAKAQRPAVRKTAPAAKETAPAADPAAVSADLIKAAVAEAVTASDERVAALLAEVKKLRKTVNQMADQPDPGVAAFKGVALTAPLPQQTPPEYDPSAVQKAGMPSMAEVADRTRIMMLRELEEQFRYTHDPAQREAAWQEICKMRGIA